jgi:acyl-CoA synthetase (AMP-forming)/AMP-acid ligase II
MDEEGYINIESRIDMIIRGGENIYPKVIEEYIRKLKSLEFQMKSTENKSVFGFKCMTNQN